MKKIKTEYVVLLFLIIFAFSLRILPLFGGFISFHFDMGRDAFIAEQIWKDFDVKIQGPATSTPGLYHGVLYYYLIAPFYALGQGNPFFVAFALALLNASTVIPLYLLAKGFFKSKSWAFLLVSIWIISFEAIQYGPWLSNPQPAVLTSAWFFYFLYQWTQKRYWGFIGACICAALSMQFQFFLLYLFFVIISANFLFKIQPPVKTLMIGISLIMLILSTMIAAVLLFGGPMQLLTSLTAFSDTKGSLDANFTDLFLTYINNLSKVFTNNLFPINVFLGGIIFVVTVIWIILKKQLFIALGFFSSVVMFFFGGHSNVYANIALVPPMLLGFVFLLKSLWPKYKSGVFFILLVVVIANFYMTLKAVPKGQYLLVIQPDMTLNNQLALIDQTYLLSDGQPFGINSLTVPLWTNTTWAYLYHYYGYQKYGYVPVFYGNDPIGTLGQDIVKKGTAEKKFYIIEPLKGIPGNIADSEFSKEDGNTSLVKEYSYGQIRIQERISKNQTQKPAEASQSAEKIN